MAGNIEGGDRFGYVQPTECPGPEGCKRLATFAVSHGLEAVNEAQLDCNTKRTMGTISQPFGTAPETAKQLLETHCVLEAYNVGGDE